MRHQRHHQSGAPRLVVAAIAGLVLGSAATIVGNDKAGMHPAGAGTPTHTYGAPPAEVFTEDYSGPPVTGDAVTLLPNLAPLSPGNRTHEVRMDVLAQRIEIAPGVRYDAWTFGGTVPGPVVHVREGDRVIFTMKNRTNEVVSITQPAKGSNQFLSAIAGTHHSANEGITAPMAHSIDFHSAMVSPPDKFRALRPGQSIRFEWVANYPGVYTYHCGVPPILHHMAMGQYGIVVVSPRHGFPTDDQVAREYAVVQSEFYLEKGEDGLYKLDWEAALEKDASHVTFNGHVNALKTTPLLARAGERIRLFVHNIGPSDTSSTHVVGTILDRVWYEGNPGNEWRGMQTVPLGASSGAVLEFVVPEPGDYFLVDHEFADAQKGAVGRIRAMPASGADSYQAEPMSH